MEKSTGKRLPEKKFKAGAIAATIWRNDAEAGSYATVNLERTYKDKDTWKYTNSLRVNDLPKAALVLSKAYDYLVSKEETPAGREEKEVMRQEPHDAEIEDVM